MAEDPVCKVVNSYPLKNIFHIPGEVGEHLTHVGHVQRVQYRYSFLKVQTEGVNACHICNPRTLWRTQALKEAIWRFRFGWLVEVLNQHTDIRRLRTTEAIT